ncbi:unnamed protein product [Rotaria sp. Silwood2]|nr:unnamed protein product [Rotaria sp. Silwood2]
MLSVILFFVFISTAAGCSCTSRPPLDRDFKQTPIIFIGRVTTVNVNKQSEFSGIADYTMIVEEAFKGITSGSIIVVHSNTAGTNCGLAEITVGARWQIWVYQDGWTDMCTRSTHNSDENRAELEKLAKSP